MAIASPCGRMAADGWMEAAARGDLCASHEFFGSNFADENGKVRPRTLGPRRVWGARVRVSRRRPTAREPEHSQDRPFEKTVPATECPSLG